MENGPVTLANGDIMFAYADDAGKETIYISDGTAAGTKPITGYTGNFPAVFPGAVAQLTATPVIGGAAGGQAMTDQMLITPFPTVSITDPIANQTETVTVTLSSAANGTLSNLGSGSYNASNGIYTVTGTTSIVTTALEARWSSSPTAHQSAAGQTVTTTFTIAVTDTAGSSASNAATNVATTETSATNAGLLVNLERSINSSN